MLPSIGRASGPGGSGGCERLSRYLRYQVKPTSATTDVAMYNPGPASSIVRTVLQFQVAEETNYCIYILYVTWRKEAPHLKLTQVWCVIRKNLNAAG